MITITSATGKIGRHVITGLLASGLPIRALAHSPTRTRAAAKMPGDPEHNPDDVPGGDHTG